MLFILGILLKLPVFFSAAAPIIKQQDSFVYVAVIGALKPLATVFPAIYVLIAYLLIFLQMYLLSTFINYNRLMSRVNFLPGMAYIVITSLIPEFNVLSSPLIVSTIYIAVFILLFAAHNQKITRGDIFNAGALLGIAVLIFLPSLFLIVWAYVVLGSLKSFKLNEWLLLLVGIFTPYYFLGILLYLNDNFNWHQFYNGFEISVGHGKFTIWHAAALFLVLMPLLAGIYYVQSLSGRMLIHVRKAWNLFILYAAICGIIPFFNVGAGMENWVLLLVPVAALHGYSYFNAEWKPYPKIAFWLSVAFIVTSQLFSGLW